MIFTVALCIACGQTDEERAGEAIARIETLYYNKEYRQALDSIKTLRKRYPKAINARKKALEFWQKASLRITQNDIAHTDSALQAVQRQIAQYGNRVYPAALRIKHDSLQIRYDVLCSTVRVIQTTKGTLRIKKLRIENRLSGPALILICILYIYETEIALINSQFSIIK